MVSSVAAAAMDNRTAFGYPLAEQGSACVAATPAGACGQIPHTAQSKGDNSNRPAGDTALVMAPRRHGFYIGLSPRSVGRLLHPLTLPLVTALLILLLGL